MASAPLLLGTGKRPDLVFSRAAVCAAAGRYRFPGLARSPPIRACTRIFPTVPSRTCCAALPTRRTRRASTTSCSATRRRYAKFVSYVPVALRGKVSDGLRQLPSAGRRRPRSAAAQDETTCCTWMPFPVVRRGADAFCEYSPTSILPGSACGWWESVFRNWRRDLLSRRDCESSPPRPGSARLETRSGDFGPARRGSRSV